MNKVFGDSKRKRGLPLMKTDLLKNDDVAVNANDHSFQGLPN